MPLVQRPIPLRLVWPLLVVILQVFPGHIIKVRSPKNNELIQTLLLYALHEPFDKGVHVRSTIVNRMHIHTCVIQFTIKCFAVFTVPIPRYDLGSDSLFLGMLNKRLASQINSPFSRR